MTLKRADLDRAFDLVQEVDEELGRIVGQSDVRAWRAPRR